jgi:sporulation protein YlmC with PRC-barrel domain
MAALLCLTLAPAAKAGEDADAPKAASSQETSSQTKATEGAPGKCNKASSILGMDVRNQNDEHLGHIKDLVIDWKTEGVSYAVISTGDRLLLDIKEKLLAVPLTALTLSPDQKCLILNAEKSKVEAAMGFDKNNWPSVSNPSWGAEPFWQKETGKPAATEQPAKEPDATAKPDMKSGQDPESKPDSDSDGK